MNLQRGGAALGVVALVAAVASGSRVLGVVGVGFLIAAVLSWLWTWLADGTVVVSHELHPSPATEGDRVRLDVTVGRRSRVPLGSLTVGTVVGRLGRRECALAGHGRTTTAQIELGRLPRGVYTLADTEVVMGDLLGLASVTPMVSCERVSVVVRPRLAALDGLFTDVGSTAADGRRVLLRRAAGFDFHSVREYEQGESLRRVHWPTSARRGQLMVKELEDTANDGVVVVLDCDPRRQAGEPPDSSFDAAVRAAGSLVQAHASRGRMATLASTGREGAVVQVRSAATDLEAVLAVLAAAEPDAQAGVARFLAGQHPWAASGEIVVVTSTDEPSAFGQILALGTRRHVAVVWIDAPSFAGRQTRVEPGLLRLAAHGLPVAVVRAGDDLASVLSAHTSRVVAHG